MREAAEELEDDMVDTRKEDRTIREFTIPLQEDVGGVLLSIHSVHVIQNDEVTVKDIEVELRKDNHLLLSGPN
jgi:ATP-binding cassette subfamily F protein 3